MAITFPDITVLQWNDLLDSMPSGYSFAQVNGQWVAFGPANKTQVQIDQHVQDAINAYSILPYAKKDGKKRVNQIKTDKYYLLYTPDIILDDQLLEAKFRDIFGMMMDADLDEWASINGASKTATANWQKVLDTRSAANTAKTAIGNVSNGASAAATMASVQAIINAVVWPS